MKKFSLRNSATFAYTIVGTGGKTAVLLHGFSDDHHKMLPLAEAFCLKGYTVYIPDLPFHGQTVWNEPSFTPSDLLDFLHFVCRETHVQQLTLLGYSMGGRLAASLMASNDELFNDVFLLAPEGAIGSISRLLSFSPHTFRLLVSAVQISYPLINFSSFFLYKTGVLREVSYRFVQLYFSNKANRHRTFCVWRSIYLFPLAPEQPHKANLHLAFGKHDKVLPAGSIEWFVKQFEYQSFYVLEGGHKIVLQKAAVWIEEVLPKG